MNEITQEWVLPSNFESVDYCCSELKKLLLKNHCDEVIFKSELLAREALNNAVVHGSQLTGEFLFRVDLTDKEVCLTVNDGGLGFGSSRENVERSKGKNTTGRGLLILEKYASDYSYNEKGNELIIKICCGA